MVTYVRMNLLHATVHDMGGLRYTCRGQSSAIRLPMSLHDLDAVTTLAALVLLSVSQAVSYATMDLCFRRHAPIALITI